LKHYCAGQQLAQSQFRSIQYPATHSIILSLVMHHTSAGGKKNSSHKSACRRCIFARIIEVLEKQQKKNGGGRGEQKSPLPQKQTKKHGRGKEAGRNQGRHLYFSDNSFEVICSLLSKGQHPSS